VFALGQLHLLAGQPEKSEGEIKKALELDPENADALVSLAAIQSTGKRMDEVEQTYERLSALPGRTYRSLHALFVFKMGKTDAAVAELEKLVKSDPDDRTVRSRLVAVYFELNKLGAAENLLNAVLKHNPKDSDALLQRSVLYMKLGKAGGAQNDLNTMLQLNPDSGEAHLGLAAVDRANGLKRSEEQELNEALRLNPALLQARLTLARNFLLTNQRKYALDLLKQTPESQKRTAGVIIELNWAWLIDGNFTEVRSNLDLVLPTNRIPEFVLQDAILKMEQRDYVGARASADEVLGRNPEDVRAAQVAADSYAAQKDITKGLQRLVELANGHPKSAPLHGLLGQWYLRAGKPAEARQAFEAAKAADPKYLYGDLMLADLDLRERQVDAARQRLTGLIAADPKNVPAMLRLASLDGESGDQVSAIARYRAVLDIDSSNLVALNNLAYVLATGDPDAAWQYAQKATETAPDNPAVQDTLGWVYYRKGMYSAATRYLKKAVSKDPTPRRQFHLAMSYLKSGNEAIGRSMLQGALLKDPNLAKTERGW